MSDTAPAPAAVAVRDSTPSAVPPPPWPERAIGLAGEGARPFALYAIAVGVFIALVRLDAAAVAAGGVVLTLMYGAKSAENAATAKQDANVKVAQAASPATS